MQDDTPEPPPFHSQSERRSRFQFSIATLLALMVLLSVVLAWCMAFPSSLQYFLILGIRILHIAIFVGLMTGARVHTGSKRTFCLGGLCALVICYFSSAEIWRGAGSPYDFLLVLTPNFIKHSFVGLLLLQQTCLLCFYLIFVLIGGWLALKFEAYFHSKAG